MGKIVKIDSDGDVAVVFGQKAVVLNPACCSPAPGCRPDQLGKGSSDGKGCQLYNFRFQKVCNRLHGNKRIDTNAFRFYISNH